MGSRSSDFDRLPPCDRERLTLASRMFAEALWAGVPQSQALSRMRPVEGTDLFHLEVHVPSPTGSEHLAVWLWMDGEEPSLAFGAWHTHATVLSDDVPGGTQRILDLFEAILHDRIVLFSDDGDSGPPDCPIDLRSPEELTNELTSPWGTGRGTLFSWGGTADRKVALDSITL